MIICPLMSNSVPITGTYDEPNSKLEEIECWKENCALWVGLMSMDGGKPASYQYGCAFKMQAMKNGDGTITL